MDVAPAKAADRAKIPEGSRYYTGDDPEGGLVYVLPTAIKHQRKLRDKRTDKAKAAKKKARAARKVNR